MNNNETRIVDGVVFMKTRDLQPAVLKPVFVSMIPERWTGGATGGTVTFRGESTGHDWIANGSVHCQTFERAARAAIKRNRTAYDQAKRVVAEFEAEAIRPFHVVQVKSVSGRPLWEVQRVRDGQTISEPSTTKAEAEDYLRREAVDLLQFA